MHSGSRILIVEDDSAISSALRDWLEAQGFHVTACLPRGEDVEAAVRRDPPDAVLMDVLLQGAVDGISAASRLHENGGPPVIFLTSNCDEQFLERAEAAQPYGFVAKPFRFLDVRIAIRLALARRRAEIAAEREHRRLELALDAADMGVWEWCEDETGLQADGRSAALLSLEDSVQLSPSGNGEEEKSLDREAILAALRNNQDLTGVHRIRKQDGRSRWVEIFARATHLTNGLPCVTGAVRDVTASIERELESRTSQVVFETAAEAIMVLSGDRLAVTANPAFFAMTGYTAEQIIGVPVEALLHARREADEFCPPLEAFEDDQWHGETACLRADGSVFIAWVHISLVRGTRHQVLHYVIAFSDTTALHEARQQLDYMAFHDTLTGLHNRLAMTRELDSRIGPQTEEGVRLGLLFLDLDGFKAINDSMGHAAGDQLLVAVARRIQGALRSRDMAIRLGGDEFVVIVSSPSGVSECQALAEKLLNTISEPVSLAGSDVRVRTSIGIAMYPEHGRTRETLMRAADAAMYAAKECQPGGYAVFSSDMREELRQRKLIEEGLRACVHGEGLSVVFQPIVSLYDGRLSGWEALARVTLPELGEVPPERFIPIAEQTGVMDQLGRCITTVALREFAAWQKARKRPYRLALNVSGRQVARESFPDELIAELKEHGLEAASVDLEVNEGLLYATEAARGVLTRLRAAGFSIVLDDFGSGMSSLGVLKHLPIDSIKIGRSFVAGLGSGSVGDLEIVRALMSLADALGLRTAASGVETESQRRQLLRLGCSEAQGNYFSLPVNLEQWEHGERLLAGMRT